MTRRSHAPDGSARAYGAATAHTSFMAWCVHVPRPSVARGD
jgi:hypothetical protein